MIVDIDAEDFLRVDLSIRNRETKGFVLQLTLVEDLLTVDDWQSLLDDDHSNVTGIFEEFDYSNVRLRADAGADDQG